VPFAAEPKPDGSGRGSILLLPLFATPTRDVLRFRALDGNSQARDLSSPGRFRGMPDYGTTVMADYVEKLKTEAARNFRET
jgi:hypothetical protein